MRVIFTGSREWQDETIVRRTLSRFVFDKPTIVVGDCKTGLDVIVRRACVGYGWDPVVFRADWGTRGKAAGPMRNAAMVGAGADLCIGFVDESKCAGTRGCLILARAAGINIHAYVLGRGWVSGDEVDEVARKEKP